MELFGFLFLDGLNNEIDVVAATSDKCTSLLIAIDSDIEEAFFAIGGLAASFFDQKGDWQDFVEELKARRMSDRLEHRVDTVTLDEELVAVHCEGSGVSQRGALQTVVLEDAEVARYLIGALESCGEQLGISSDFEVGHSDDPALFGAHLEECELLNTLVLGVVENDGGPRAIDSECGSTEVSACETVEVGTLVIPDGED